MPSAGMIGTSNSQTQLDM